MVKEYDFNYSGGYITIQDAVIKLDSIDYYRFDPNQLVMIINGVTIDFILKEKDNVESIKTQLQDLFNPREIV